jgi:hypothetical protein
MKIAGFLLLGAYRLGRMNTSQLRDASLPHKYVGVQTARKHFCEKSFPLWDIYSPRQLEPTDDDTGFSAEHVYPRSFIEPNGDAKKDIHNLFPTRLFINRHRSNYRFSETLVASDSIKIIDHRNSDKELRFDESFYNYKDSQQKTFIPIRISRGTIARSIAYMGLVYPELDIQDVIDLKLLKKWNKENPPDNREIIRNKKIKSIQYNENPFIIVPELIDAHF